MYYNYFELIYIETDRNDYRIKQIIKIAKLKTIKIIDINSYISINKNKLSTYFKNEILIDQRFNVSAVSILIVNMYKNINTLPLEIKLFNTLKKDYKLSIVSSDPASPVFSFIPNDYSLLLKKNIKSIYMRNYISKYFYDSTINNDILVYDFPYSIASPDMIISEEEDILFRNLISAVPPDYVIYLLPINRLTYNFLEGVTEFFRNNYMLQINNFIVYDRIFDELQYSSSKSITSFKCCENTKILAKKRINREYKTPIFYSWDELAAQLIVKQIEKNLGSGIQYQVL